MSHPAISVVIASYNHEDYVTDAIESVLRQKFQDFEIIITDDGSSDDTVSKIRRFRDQRIHLFEFGKNKGACAALNNSVLKSNGKYVAVLNSDDMWLPDKLSAQYDILESRPEIGAAFTNALFVGEAGDNFSANHRPSFFEIFAQNNESQGQWLKKFFIGGNCLCHPSILIRRSCYNTIGLYDNRFRQLPDLDMWIRLIKKYSIHVLPDKLVHFRLLPHEQNASNQLNESNRIRNINEFYLIMKHFFDDMPFELFIDGFRELMKYEKYDGDQRYECEKAFVFLNAPTPWFSKCYRLISLQKFYDLLAKEEIRRLLEIEYSFTEKTFMDLMASTDFFSNLQPVSIDEPRLNTKYSSVTEVWRDIQKTLTSSGRVGMSGLRNIIKRLQ